MMGMTGMQSAVLQERMASTLLSHTSALHAADAALQEAQQWLQAQPTRPVASSDGSSGMWLRDYPDPVASNAVPWWEELDCLGSAWWQGHAREAPYLPTGTASSHWLIEEFGVITGPEDASEQVVSFRITVRGTAYGDSMPTVGQAIVVKKYPHE